MNLTDAASAGAASVPKFDMRLGPDTDGTALAAYRQNVGLLYRLEFEPEDAARFYARATTYMLPRAVLARVESVAQTLRRGPDEIARGGDQISLFVLTRGALESVYGERERKVTLGDVVIIDYACEIESRSGDFGMVYLMMPRDSVPPSLLGPSVHGTVLAASSAAGRLLRGAIETLIETIDGLSVAEADAATTSAFKLAEGMFDGARARLAGQAPSTDTRALEKALSLIDRELASSDLSPARLESALALSRSGLYRLFEPFGGVRAAILQRRLDGAVKALLDTNAERPPLRLIARDYGFQSEEQLSRAFRARFAATPSQFHDMVRRRDHAGLAEQAERAGFANVQAWIEALPAGDAGSAG
jgi:AraC-like DNA-binding protein